MIEERLGPRFGPWVANGLLILVALAIAVVSINWVITLGLLPASTAVADFIRGNEITISWIGVASYLLSAVLPAIGLWVGFRLIVRPTLRKSDQLMSDAVSEFENRSTEQRQFSETLGERVDQVSSLMQQNTETTERSTSLARQASQLAERALNDFQASLERGFGDFQARLEALETRISKLERSKEPEKR